MYLCSVLTPFALALLRLMCARIADARHTIIDHDTYNKMFTLHGAIQVFLVIYPGHAAALGNIVMPLQLGAKDVAFPRMNLASYYLWVVGALFMLSSLVINAVTRADFLLRRTARPPRRPSYRPPSAHSSWLQLYLHWAELHRHDA